MFQLIYKKEVYTRQEFRMGITFQEGNSLLNHALHFCSQWLNGEKEFTLHTSGSTGRPKAIVLSRIQMEESARNTGQFLQLFSTDVALVSLNPTYVAGKMMLVRAMEFGMTAILTEPNLTAIEEILPQNKFTFLAFVPLQFNALLEKNLAKHLSKAKAILLGGAPMHHSLEKRIKSENLPVYHTFGMTETVSHIALKNILRSDFYKVLPNISIKTDHRNCLMIKGKVTQNEWLITNDLVEIKESDFFVWKGRIDNVINTGGVKIQLEEVEKVVEKVFFDALGENVLFAIVAIPDKILGEKICLVIESDSITESVIHRLKE